MLNLLPLLVFWPIMLWAMRGPVHRLFYLFFATLPFGAFAVIPTGLTGGLTFTATPIVCLLIIARTFLTRGGASVFLTMAIMPRRLLLLLLFWIVAGIATGFMPRLFADAVMVVPVRGLLSEPASLKPSVQNLSQYIYMSIAVLTVFAFARLLQSPLLRQHALIAMCLGAAVTVLTGMADFASQYLPVSSVLAPFRTASYALMTEVQVFGSKRVVGLMPEASAYGTQCLSLLCMLYFYRRAILGDRLRNLIVPGLLGGLLLCAWLSKSTGTYVGIGLFAAMALVEWVLRANSSRPDRLAYRRGLAGELSIAVWAFIGFTFVLMIWPQVLEPVYALIDRMVLQKSSSQSFEERGMWRAVSLAALYDTYGLGVGLGGTRASSSLVAIFASTGLAGGLLYCLFLLQTMMRSPASDTAEAQLLLSAFRFSFIPMFTISLMNAEAVFDPYVAFGFGITTALSIWPGKRPSALTPTVPMHAGTPPLVPTG